MARFFALLSGVDCQLAQPSAWGYYSIPSKTEFTSVSKGRTMRLALAIVMLTMIPVTPALLAAENPTKKPFEITKDPQAMMIATNAVNAMGGEQAIAAYLDSVATGQLTIHEGNTDTSCRITFESKGRLETRVELDMPEGKTVRITNQGRAAIRQLDGSVQALGLNNVIAERVSYIPLLSLLAEYKDPNVSVVYRGAVEINGRNTGLIAISFVPKYDLKHGALYSSITETLFYVDQATSFVDKIQYENYEEGHSQQGHRTIEEYLTQYQNVSGIEVPFHQISFSNGMLEDELIIKTVTFNTGLAEGEFTIPQGAHR